MRKATGLINMLAARIVPEQPAASTPGAAVAGMLLHGWGFAHRPLAGTPQVFAHTPRELLWRAGGDAERCQRLPRGRRLDAVQAEGGALWCSARALAVCAQAGRAQRGPPLDPTRLARRGASGPESAPQAMRLPHGDAKDHRPDWTQAGWERLGSQDGGVPLGRNRWAGTASATPRVQVRAQALMTAGARAPTPRYGGAEAQLCTADTAVPLAQRGGITRLVGPRQRVAQVSRQALPWATGHARHATTRSAGRALCHYGRAPRWLVGSSAAALDRAEARVTTAGSVSKVEIN